jgi:parallel beta-helix repeat protein
MSSALLTHCPCCCSHNRIFKGSDGIVVKDDGKGTIESNTVCDVTQYGIHVLLGGNPTILGNHVSRAAMSGLIVSQVRPLFSASVPPQLRPNSASHLRPPHCQSRAERAVLRTTTYRSPQVCPSEKKEEEEEEEEEGEEEVVVLHMLALALQPQSPSLKNVSASLFYLTFSTSQTVPASPCAPMARLWPYTTPSAPAASASWSGTAAPARWSTTRCNTVGRA